MNQPWWEASYRDGRTVTWGNPSLEIVDLVDTLPAGASVLDAGCGDGRHALFLSRHGMRVDAFDKSEAAIAKLKTLAAGQGLIVNSWVQDIRSFEPSKMYDVVVCQGVLHFLLRAEWSEVLSMLKACTGFGGVNVIAVFTDSIPAPRDLAPSLKGLFHEGELVTLYSDWEVTFHASYVFEDEHPSNIHHTHAINKIIARKPGVGYCER